MLSRPSNLLFTVQRTLAPQLPTTVLRWTLDAPSAGQLLALRDGSFRLQGWLLLHPGQAMPPTLLWRVAGDGPLQRQAFNSGRPDVIAQVLGESPAGHPQLLCGFALAIALDDRAQADGIELGFELTDGTVFWAARLALQPVTQVIDGADGQLFLDNDSNRSVDQYTGALLLGAPALRQWRGFLADSRALAARMQARHALLVAPAKEEVLRHAYPHQRAATTVLDQVRGLVCPGDHLVDGATVLAAQPDPAAGFKRTDTHWTDRGAMWATLAALAELGCDVDCARHWLKADAYVEKPYAGDLGVKLLPQRIAATEFLDAPAPEAEALFDNLLPNMGRVLVFETPLAPFAECLLVFGASSAYPMLKFLKRLFRRVVFVHSAGRVDVAVVEHERPQRLLLQSTARFLVQPPDLDFSLATTVAAKLAEAPAARRDAARASAARWSAADAFYVSMLGAHHRQA